MGYFKHIEPNKLKLKDKRLLEKVIRAVERFGLLSGGERVLLAVSGGPDSVFLSLAMNSIAPKYKLQLAVAHFNHKLRGEESEEDARFVHELADVLGLKFFVGEGDVKEFARKNKLSMEQAARTLRYEFLEDTARSWDADRVALGHTLSDSAETVMLNLLRGAGIQGAGGIPPKRSIFIRPIILLKRNEIVNYLDSHGIPYRLDSSNFDTRFTRNFLRLKVFPLLERRFKRFEEHLANFGFLLRKFSTELSPYFQQVIDILMKPAPDGELILDRWKLLKIDKNFRSNIYLMLFGPAFRLDSVHISAIDRAVENGGRVELPSGWKLEASEGDVRLFQLERSLRCKVRISDFGTWYMNEINSIVEIKRVGTKLDKFSQFTVYIPEGRIKWPIVMRKRMQGDKIRLKAGFRSLKKLFIDMKIPRWRRELIPIFEDAYGVFWVAGIASAYRIGNPPFIKFEIRRKHEDKFWIYDNIG